MLFAYGFRAVWFLPGQVLGGGIFGGGRAVGVLVSVLMRLHARNRCPGSFLAAAVNVGLGARSTPAASGISRGAVYPP